MEQINELKDITLSKCRQATTKEQTMKVANLYFDLCDVGKQMEKDLKNERTNR